MSDSSKLAENKLILLFLLQKIDLSLSNNEICQFALERNIMDYFNVQQYLSELAEANFLEEFSDNGTTRYHITPEGSEALEFFQNRIPEWMRNAANEYILNNRQRIKNEYETSANIFPEINEKLDEATMELFAATEEEKTVEKMISEAKNADGFFKLMRKPMKIQNRQKFRKKLLENEENLIDFIKEKTLRNAQDIFIENALYFFLHAKTDCCDWILTEYKNVRSAYMQSMLCLALGVRGDIAVVPFLQKEAMRFMTEDFNEDGFLEQGPLYGLHELVLRLEK